MPETLDPTAPVTSHETIVPTQVSIETLDSNGKSLPANSNLSAIFDKIESGVDRKDAVREVMSKKAAKPAPVKKEEVVTTEGAEVKVAKEIKVTSSHPDGEEVKGPASDLNDALNRSQERKQHEAENKEEIEKSVVEETIPEEELQVLPNDKPKTAKRINALLKIKGELESTIATTKKEVEDKAKAMKELEEKFANVKTVDPKIEEEIQNARKELSMFRRRYDLDKDPSIKEKFDSRIEQSDAAIPEILKRHNAGEAVINLIKEEGGWSKFSKSNRIVTLADGSRVSSAELADQIVEALPFADRKTVDSLTMESISLRRERERFVEAELKQAEEFFKKRDEDMNRGNEDYKKQVKQAEETIKKWQEKVAVDNAFLKEKEVPATASAEEKKSIAEDNAVAKELNEVLKKNLNTKDLEGMLNIVLDATKFYQEKREKTKIATELTKVKAELKAKSDELDNFKKSGRVVPKAGSLTGGGSQPPSTKAPKAQTLEEAFNNLAAARGTANDD